MSQGFDASDVEKKIRDASAHVRGVVRAEGANGAMIELYLSSSIRTSVDCRDGKVDSMTQAADEGLSIRILKGRKMGFSFTTSLDPVAIARAAKSALQIAEIMPDDPFHRLGIKKGLTYPDYEQFDQEGLSVPLDRKIEMAMSLERVAKAADPRITAVRKASFSQSASAGAWMDPEGEVLTERGTHFSVVTYCKSDDEGDSQSGYDFQATTKFTDLDPSHCAKSAALEATLLLGAKQPESIKCEAVFRNDTATEILGFLESHFQAEGFDKNQSLFIGKIGKQIFSHLVSIINDGTLKGGIATSRFDAEGTPCKRISVVADGVFQAPLSSLYYEAKCGFAPTGSTGRGTKSPPKCSTQNFFMESGKTPLADLIGQIKKGVLITELMGVHSANQATGDFSVGASGLMIENGKISRPIKGFAIAGNIVSLLSSVTGVANDFRWFGSTGSPSFLVPQISLGGGSQKGDSR